MCVQLDDESLFVEDTKPDNTRIHLQARRAKRPRASKQKRITTAQAVIFANQPLPLAPASVRTKYVKGKGLSRREHSR